MAIPLTTSLPLTDLQRISSDMCEWLTEQDEHVSLRGPMMGYHPRLDSSSVRHGETQESDCASSSERKCLVAD
jgi:hypothetical protein